jgi:CDP-diacylglycerol--glycerol-3-phosphate 3-phosphatidyltransferase
VTPGSRWTLPNIITVVRIVACPAILVLALAESSSARFSAAGLYLAAALSDVWDGYLARKHGWITDMGKLLDPFADKLLLATSFVPIYIISHRPGEVNELPWWGTLPLWVLLVVFGRELAITVFRSWAQRRGTVIAAGSSGKHKALFQSMFSVAALLWYPLRQVSLERSWTGSAWSGWSMFHGAFVAITLGIAVVLTVYSGIEYFWNFRSVGRQPPTGGGTA